MADDQEVLEEILGTLHGALYKTASSAPPLHRQYAAELLDFANTYAATLPTQIVWDPPPEAVRHLTHEVIHLVKNDDWREALEQSHAVLSMLPGEPGGIPMKPPKLPW